METTINRENFISGNIDNFIDIFNSFKENYKLLGIMDNSRVEKFTKIILSSITFLEKEESDNDSDCKSDDEFVEEEYYN
jgi:hypothetical protein|tara:strand:- start:261 stop:497 length:237 start_codon:yes stop_codon:yes gene_type:complete